MIGLERDRHRERQWLAETVGASDPAGYIPQVRRRLEQGERDYGDRWTRTPLVELVLEIAEEAVDIAAWAVLTDQALDALGVTAVDQKTVRRLLRDAAQDAARAHTATMLAAAIVSSGTERNE